MNKPIIGIVGGIGSGKSYISRMFEDAGCKIIDSDKHAHRAYEDTNVLNAIKEKIGDSVFNTDGSIDRKKLANLVFNKDEQRIVLENIIHPVVIKTQNDEMLSFDNDCDIIAFVLDSPLLFETGLHKQCDYIVYVDSPKEIRLQRVKQHRGWTDNDLDIRESKQIPLSDKQKMSDIIIDNSSKIMVSQIDEIINTALYKHSHSYYLNKLIDSSSLKDEELNSVICNIEVCFDFTKEQKLVLSECLSKYIDSYIHDPHYSLRPHEKMISVGSAIRKFIATCPYEYYNKISSWLLSGTSPEILVEITKSIFRNYKYFVDNKEKFCFNDLLVSLEKVFTTFYSPMLMKWGQNPAVAHLSISVLYKLDEKYLSKYPVNNLEPKWFMEVVNNDLSGGII